MSLKKLSLTYIDEFGETCQADFNNHEYHSLMELLFDKYLQDWGDCKGRAWCGTCHIQLHSDRNLEKMDINEENTLSNITGRTKTSRLACQIPLDSNLDGIVFSILKDDAV
ncbi:2Fe-2S iron-sulfur cluster-binding protein [Zobellia galactanivorans]|uniref:2Fe-2S ferredoxin n=1 Tax=Zobellia galactanivorans (strain DSM 12802 / CCUG 47099 / CIP 106680 / NCIMB 13871 / Dsij) TaxID=63186 RepID=G0L5P3_ZOBGA|nr:MULTISPECIES: 2Fe-2S iron-sulfur cluster-binding protein [Zobellia]MDO6807339.1 2Fe-2S iron-sulfur cluster-binding protein [Zobellia galactanivorans]OWW27261.1 hypothetical protein B4Q04_06270 [Zobellia sp. OII3]CAZ96400.1 2Fe-2S ferredoxin [Zobellia galactanivorans]